MNSRLLSKRVAVALRAPTTARRFHSPYTVLGSSPLTTPHSSATPSENSFSALYEKHYDVPSEVTSHAGYRTYVVSEPDESNRHYQVPAGAYPTSSPYIHFKAASPPDLQPGESYSSTGSQLAHPFTTRAVPQNPSGVGESSAVRFKSAPGEMGARGGGYGGLKMMDRSTTTAGTGKLGERNPQPDGPAAEKFSKAGVENAWKMRI